MALIYWAELYFRSLKRNRVFPLLTQYLFLYKKVCIPHVGMFEIIQEPPQLNVADKIFTPPGFKTKYAGEDFVPEHQFDFFSAAANEKENIKQELFSFGERLRNKIQQSPFYWKGLGTLRYHFNEIIFEAEEIKLISFQNIPAQKVLRENVQHHLLVGDRELSSREVTEALNQVKQKTPWFIIVGWMILLLAIIFILIILYAKNFEPAAAGL